MRKSLGFATLASVGVMSLALSAFTAIGEERAKDRSVALDGNCAVCLVKGGKFVPGSADYAADYRGSTYLFPSDKERQMFLAEPAKYVVAVQGTSDCAACRFGKHPLKAPKELGLAIVANNRVYIVEDAHKLYPDLYEQRFDKVAVAALGTPIKTDGKFVWLQPASVAIAPIAN